MWWSARWALALTGAGVVGCAGRGAAPTAGGAPAVPAAPPNAAAGRGRAPGGDDSVSVGYGTRTRRELTGAVGSVTGRTGERDGAVRVEEMLRRVPGVVVTRRSSGAYAVRVRGAGAKLSADAGGSSGDPLFVLDGVPLPVGPGALDNISPSDVERIDVLKDAEAAIYGSQGGNGVILVRTRRWKP